MTTKTKAGDLLICLSRARAGVFLDVWADADLGGRLGVLKYHAWFPSRRMAVEFAAQHYGYRGQ